MKRLSLSVLFFGSFFLTTSVQAAQVLTSLSPLSAPVASAVTISAKEGVNTPAAVIMRDAKSGAEGRISTLVTPDGKKITFAVPANLTLPSGATTVLLPGTYSVSLAANGTEAESNKLSFRVTDTPALSVTAPKGGEVWKIGSRQRIGWKYLRITGIKSVTISLLDSSGTAQWKSDVAPYYTDIATGSTIAVVSRSFEVPELSEGNYTAKVRVVSKKGDDPEIAYEAVSAGSVRVSKAIRGEFDTATCDATASLTGWACDPSDFAKPIREVRFYNENNQLVQSTQAVGLSRPDVASAGVCGGTGEHGFSVALSNKLRDGQSHTLSAVAIDILGKRVPFGSAKTIQCAKTVSGTTGTSKPGADFQVSCGASVEQALPGADVSWRSLVTGGRPPAKGYSYVWTGSAGIVPANSADVSAKYTSVGTKSARVKVTNLDTNASVIASCSSAISVKKPTADFGDAFTCAASRNPVAVGTNVVWNITQTKASPHTFSYTWTGSAGIVPADSMSVSARYTSQGTKSARVMIKAENGTSVRISCTPLSVKKPTADFQVSCAADPSSVRLGVGATGMWNSSVSGGVAPERGYAYAWAGTAGLAGASASIPAKYSSLGTKTARVKVTNLDNGTSVTATCSPGIVVARPTADYTFRCEPVPASVVAGMPVTWVATATSLGDAPHLFKYEWSGTAGISRADAPSISASYKSRGTKTARLKVTNTADNTSQRITCSPLTVTKAVSAYDFSGSGATASVFDSLRSFLESILK